MAASSRSATVEPEEVIELPAEFQELSLRIDEKPESFVVGNEDIRLAALKATKYVFDLGAYTPYIAGICMFHLVIYTLIALQTESKSRAQINELLASLSPSQAPQTRAQARAQKTNGPQKLPEVPKVRDTPIPELTVDGMDEDQIWAQLELRAQNLADVLEAALEGTGEVPESGDESEAGSMARKMRGMGIGMEDHVDMDMDGMDFEDDEDSEDTDSEEYDEDSEEEDDDEEDEDEEEDEEEEDYGEDVTELRDPSDGEGDVELDAPTSKKRKARGKGKGKGHPELDDGFFDLAAFNAETEEVEARASSKGKLGRGDSDDEDADLEDVDMFAPVDDVEAEGDDQGMRFNLSDHMCY